MGKFKKNKPSIKLLNVPLDQQLSETVQQKNRQKVRDRKDSDDEVRFNNQNIALSNGVWV